MRSPALHNKRKLILFLVVRVGPKEYQGCVGFVWDEESKAGINFRKHGVRIPAIPVFDNLYAITLVDDESDPNRTAVHHTWDGGGGRLLVVAYAWCGENIRIISARAAENHEREEYEADR
jgi:uncharacterized protein